MTSQFKILLMAVLLHTLPACGFNPGNDYDAARSAPLEIALNTFDGRGLYVLENDLVVHYECEASVVVINRANCDKSVQKLYFWGVQDHLRKDFGAEIDYYENSVHQYVVKINLIDSQIDQMLAVEPDRHPDLLPQISALREAISDDHIKISEIEDQIARIKRELDRRDDHDLRLLLEKHEGDADQLRRVRNLKQDKLKDLRQQYYDAHSAIISAQSYQRLLNQRREAVGEHTNSLRLLTRQMEEQTAFHGFMKFLRDGASWEFSSRDSSDDLTSMVAQGMGRQFQRYFAPNGNISVPVKWNKLLGQYQVTIPAPGVKLREIYIWSRTATDCKTFRIKSDLFDVTLPLYRRADRQSYTAEEAPLFEQTIAGHWTITPTCSGEHNPDDYQLEINRIGLE